MTKTTTRRDGPGLKRLRASPAAETIRSAVLDDQRNGRAAALAKIEAEKAEAADAADAIDLPAAFILGTSAAAHLAADAPHAPEDPDAPPHATSPATARPERAPAAVQPTPVPTPAESMPGMSRANAALYMLAAAGLMPTPPDFSKPAYAARRKALAEVMALVEAGVSEGLRAYAIKVYCTSAQELDRYRHRAIIAIEARRAGLAAA